MKRALMKVALIATMAASSIPAFADHHSRRVVLFTDGDRQVVRTYYTENYRDGCPPGYFRRGYDCLTTGFTRRQYIVGRPLARTIVIQPVPEPLVGQLVPAPVGYRYGVVDGDVVKYAVGTRLVVDAIRALAH